MKNLLLASLVLGAPVAPAPKPPAAAPRLYAVVLKADWCQNCRVLGPKAMAILPPLMAQGVMPVELDMTSDATRTTALATAKRLGILKVVQSEDGTGIVLLVDAKRKTKLGVLASNLTEDEMKARVQAAMGRVAEERTTTTCFCPGSLTVVSTRR